MVFEHAGMPIVQAVKSYAQGFAGSQATAESLHQTGHHQAAQESYGAEGLRPVEAPADTTKLS